MQMLVTLAVALVRSLLALFRSRAEQAIVELTLRQQLAVYGVCSQYSSGLILLGFSALPS
jgi:hypothetical protein